MIAITAAVVPSSSAAPAAGIGPQVSIVGGPPPLRAYEDVKIAFWAGSPPQVTKGIAYQILPDHTPLLLDEYRPSGEGRFPGLLVIHGGGWKAGGRGTVKAEAYTLAEEGFAAFAVDYRLAPGNQGSDLWPAQIEDLRAAMEYVRKLPYVTNKVGAFGVSAGGHLAMYLATTGDTGTTRADAAASLSGPAKLDILNSKNPEYEAAVTNLLGCPLGGENECPAVWLDASPYSHVDEATSPIYAIQSWDDPLVNIEQLRLMGAKLNAVGVHNIIREVAKSGHVDAVEPKAFGNEMTSFLWSTLGPAEQPVTYTCSLDGVDPKPCPPNVASYGHIAPGSHTISVQATDALGQVGPPTDRTWQLAPIGATVAVTDGLFTPSTISVPQGSAVLWNFDGIMRGHSVTDASGLSLYNSGEFAAWRWPGGGIPDYRVGFLGAGVYLYKCVIDDTMTGAVEVPILASPPSGTTTTAFDVIWAAMTAPTGIVYDVQIMRPGPKSWVDWLTDQTIQGATFTPDAGIGTYKFRSRLQVAGKPFVTGYSSAATITVTP
jgi:acetyl esterase/lipase/plastocyanin